MLQSFGLMAHLERHGAHPTAPTDSQIGRKSKVVVIKLPGRDRLGMDRPASWLVTHMRTHQRFQNELFISRWEFPTKQVWNWDGEFPTQIGLEIPNSGHNPGHLCDFSRNHWKSNDGTSYR